MIFVYDSYKFSANRVLICFCDVFCRPAAASKVAHPSRIMPVLLLGALSHQCDIKSTKNLNSKIIDVLALC